MGATMDRRWPGVNPGTAPGHAREHQGRSRCNQGLQEKVRARDLLSLAAARVRGGEAEDGGWLSLLDLVGRLDDSRIRRRREDLKAVGLDREIEANGQKSYRLAIEPQHIRFDREALGRVPELEVILRTVGVNPEPWHQTPPQPATNP